MRMHQIEIDDDVYAYLKANAEPLVDTPNSVLRRALLGGRPGRKATAIAESSVGESSGAGTGADVQAQLSNAPQALRQIVEVATLVSREGRVRSEATGLVARRRGVASQTVLDKYSRQLGLTAAEFDTLLAEPRMSKLRGMLRLKFPRWSSEIEAALSA